MTNDAVVEAVALLLCDTFGHPSDPPYTEKTDDAKRNWRNVAAGLVGIVRDQDNAAALAGADETIQTIVDSCERDHTDLAVSDINKLFAIIAAKDAEIARLRAAGQNFAFRTSERIGDSDLADDYEITAKIPMREVRQMRAALKDDTP